MRKLSTEISESFINEAKSPYVKFNGTIDLKKYKKISQSDFDRLKFYDVIAICKKDTNIVWQMKILHSNGYACNYLTNEFDMSVRGIDTDKYHDFYVFEKNPSLYSNGKGKDVEVQKVLDKLKDKLYKHFSKKFDQILFFKDESIDGKWGSYEGHFNIEYSIDGYVGIVAVKTDFSNVRVKIVKKQDWTRGTGHLAGNRKAPKIMKEPEQFKKDLEIMANKFLLK